MVSRKITTKINWILDNLVPSFLRDNKVFMSIIIRAAFGKYTPFVMDFKDNLPEMTDYDIDKVYRMIVDAPINKRNTDLNPDCVKFIFDNVIGKKILDAACGRGFMVDKLVWGGYSVKGMDIALPNGLREKSEYVIGRLQKMPFEDNEFDTVICTHALEHIRNPESAIAELIRVARLKLIVIVPKQREYKYTPDLHINFYPYLYSFKKMMINCGIPKDAEFRQVGGDWGCVVDMNKHQTPLKLHQ